MAQSGLGFGTRMIAALALLAGLAGCGSLNPATGRWQPVLVSAEEEEEIGRESHDRFLSRFNLARGDEIERLQKIVDRIGRRLAAVSEAPELKWRFYILDDDSVNAFAAPGGRVYVTRGLLAFADEEADLASALAHEIGHVVAAHYKDMLAAREPALEAAKKKVRAEIEAEIRARPVSATAEPPNTRAIADRIEAAALATLAEVSQRNELEADTLGLRYLARAGYAPKDALRFMTDVITLQGFLDREAKALGLVAPEEVFQSHPLNAARLEAVAAALDEANGERRAANGETAASDREIYLKALDGVGVERADVGRLRGDRFGWPDLGFRLTAPEGVTLAVTSQGVVGAGEDQRTLYLDVDAGGAFPDIESALDDLRMRLAAVAGRAEAAFAADARKIRVGPWRALRVDIPPSEHPESNRLSMVVVETEDATVRLIYGGESRKRSVHDRAMRRLLASLRPIPRREAADFAPLRLRVAPFEADESIAEIAARTPVYGLGTRALDKKRRREQRALAEERLRLINGLEPGQQPTVGMLLKRLVR